jgi:hypothetical protein
MTVTVYFIQAEGVGRIKIGHTSREPASRLRCLQTSSPARLTLLGTIKGGARREREVHQMFAHLRVTGEWFEPGKDLLDFIKAGPNEEDAAPSPVEPDETWLYAEHFKDPLTGYSWEIWVDEKRMASQMRPACWMTRSWTEQELERVGRRSALYLWQFGTKGWRRPLLAV